MKLQPILKYTGSKSNLAEHIIKNIPTKIATMYEPFAGSAALSCRMMHDNHNVDKYIISDVNGDVIDYFNCVKNNPAELKAIYDTIWNKIYRTANKQDEYNSIRSEFNNIDSSTYKTGLFAVLNRTCINGLVRYNKSGKFNAPYHHNRDGMQPANFARLVDRYHKMFNDVDVTFIQQSYENISPTVNDYVFMDPPYFNTGLKMYKSDIDQESYFNFLRRLKSNYSFTYDGLKNGNVVHDILNND